MSKQKLTPVMMLKEAIKQNIGNFHDESFYYFLIDKADLLIKKERKVIKKAYNHGKGVSQLFQNLKPEYEGIDFLDGKDYYNSIYRKKIFNKEFVVESDLDTILKESEEKNDSKLVENKPQTKNTTESEKKIVRQVVENKNEEEEITKELLQALKGIGITPKSIKVIKM